MLAKIYLIKFNEGISLSVSYVALNTEEKNFSATDPIKKVNNYGPKTYKYVHIKKN